MSEENKGIARRSNWDGLGLMEQIGAMPGE